MSTRDPFEPVTAVIVEETEWIAVEALCSLSRLDVETLAELVDLGVVSPRGADRHAWQLPASALPRLRIAGRLMHDLGVNPSGIAVVLELLELQRELERRLRALERR